MSNFFNMDNPFFSTLSKIFDLLFISIVWTFLCIPIITIGPANTALYYTVVKVIRKERGYLIREFFKSFRTNFKRAAIVGVVLTLIGAILVFDLLYSLQIANEGGGKGSILLGVFIAISFIVIGFSIYVFPILSRFEMTVKQLFKAAIFMSMRHLLSTLAMVVVTVSFVAVMYLFAPVLIFIVPGLTALINSYLMERIFKKYMPQTDGPGEETGKDEWYLD
ncbi:MAG TPA: DUF624 domain-containing protein [Mobilitalea sp.]|nr:DUF624 domain-containing protein [Mobilitalea sp.]